MNNDAVITIKAVTSEGDPAFASRAALADLTLTACCGSISTVASGLINLSRLTLC
jgi:hypothetical protein